MLIHRIHQYYSDPSKQKEKRQQMLPLINQLPGEHTSN